MSRATKATEAEVEQRLAAIEYVKGSVAHLVPDRNLADELIEDRRAEMRRRDASRVTKSLGVRADR